MPFNPASQIFTTSYLETQSSYCRFYDSESTNKFLSRLLLADYPNISASLGSASSFSILALGPEDVFLKNIILYLSDHFHDVPVKIYFRNLFDSTLSYFQESSLDISLFSYNDSNDCQSIFFDFTTFAFPFSESFCSKLSKYFEFDLPYFLDSNKNQFVSVSTLYKLLAGVDEIEFASIIEFATQLYPIELSQTSSRITTS